MASADYKTIFTMVMLLLVFGGISLSIMGYQFGVYQKYNISSDDANLSAAIMPVAQTVNIVSDRPDCTNTDFLTCSLNHVKWIINLTFLNSDISWIGWILFGLGVAIILMIIKDIVIPLVPKWL